MLTSYDRALRLRYIANYIKSVRLTAPLLKRMRNCFEDAEEPCLFELTAGELLDTNTSPFRNDKRQMKSEILKIIATGSRSYRRYKTSPLKKSVDLIADNFHLMQTERDIFDHILRLKFDRELGTVTATLFDESSLTKPEIYAAALDLPVCQVKAALSNSGRLCRHALIIKYPRKGGIIDYTIHNRLAPMLEDVPKNFDVIRTNVLGTPLVQHLAWSDFPHLGGEKELAEKLIASALKTGEKGINILVYGPPGTGKTEFCKTVAAKAGARLYTISDKDEWGDAASADERLQDLMMKNQWIADGENAVLLFDEMEDIGPGKLMFRNMSGKQDVAGKSFFNTLLEDNPVPVLWTCNDMWWFDEAFLRRMSLAIEIKKPAGKHMKHLLINAARKENYALDEKLADEIAGYHAISPGIFTNALRVAKLTGGGKEDLKTGIFSVIKAIHIGRPVTSNVTDVGHRFNQEIANTDIAVETLSQNLAVAPSKSFSCCFYGPPGTGKSAYARFLAEKLEMDVLFKRASDLLSPYIGMTEKKIACAFSEAVETQSFLIIDEADSFLQDRRSAQRSWEVTQVNEMLTWLEDHPLPIALTTNCFDRLDTAVLRRLTFKVKFDYLDQVQAEKAFAHFFAMSAPPELRRLEFLTPGDFAVVQKRARMTGADSDPHLICKMLTAECEAKPEHVNPVGFER